jgi:hypothetical protein
MRKHLPKVSKGSAVANQGVALVLTLFVVALLTVVVVGFNSVTRTELTAARNYTKQASGKTYVSIAEARASALLAGLFTVEDSILITQPGRAMLKREGSGWQEVLLSSLPDAGGVGGLANLNPIIRSNNDILWGAITTNTNTAYFAAPWVLVRDQRGQPTGRYAFWIDDNGSRLNLNYSEQSARNSFYPTNARPLDALRIPFGHPQNPAVFTNNLRGFPRALQHADAPVMTTNRSPHAVTWGYFFVPEQVRSFGATNANQANNRTTANRLFNSIQWQISGGAGNITNKEPPPLGRKFDLNEGGFISGPGVSPAEVDLFISETIDNNLLVSLFGGETFDKKYEADILRQIAVNISDYPLATGSPSAQGNTTVTGAALLGNNGVPQYYAGQRPFPYLNEIVYRVGYTTNGVPEWYAAEVQIWIGVEIVNPYDQPWGLLGRVTLERWGSISVDVNYTIDDQVQTASFSTPDWTGFSEERMNLYINNNLPAKTFAIQQGQTPLVYAFEWQVERTELPPGASNVIVKNVTITPGTITWRQWFDDPETVRDWAQSSDFSPSGGGAHFTFNDVEEFSHAAIGAGNYGPRTPPQSAQSFFNNAASRGIAKNDPRVRTFASYAPPLPAWYPVEGAQVTFAGNNSTVDFAGGTGIPNVPNDLPPASGNILDHPDFNRALGVENTPFVSVFELGKVHTGLQWRTLQLHAQQEEESNQGLVPDWMFLELFGVRRAFVPASVRMNPNALPYPAISLGLTPENASGQGLLRSGGYAGLFAGFVGNNPLSALLLLDNEPTNAGLSASAAFGENEAQVAATNVASMNFRPQWRQRRRGLDGFPQGVYAGLSELAEVIGVGNAGETSTQMEERLRVVYECLTPYSNTFTIYSIGEALEVVDTLTGQQTNVIGSLRTRTEVVINPTTGEVSRVLTMPVITP